MTRFVKTRIPVVSAVLFLLALYAIGGLGYAIWTRSAEAAATWAVVAGVALVASIAFQRWSARKDRSGS